MYQHANGTTAKIWILNAYDYVYDHYTYENKYQDESEDEYKDEWNCSNPFSSFPKMLKWRYSVSFVFHIAKTWKFNTNYQHNQI